ncbi:uncharacterized protein LOC127751297 [Frankliniella occidentalis]|uniref:Uncharacterized protein LOC127751297 n=1 Tax=Frankliniella occidentalis TaxID=133901 RepID=A0A9C6XTJ6_FRAOC|nr:uncharacterized protein LOC127751297 [Frankliniella occidentalis]
MSRCVEKDLYISDEDTMEPLVLSQDSEETKDSSCYTLELHPSGMLYEESSCDPEAAPPASPPAATEVPAEALGACRKATSEEASFAAFAYEDAYFQQLWSEEAPAPESHPLSMPFMEEETCDGLSSVLTRPSVQCSQCLNVWERREAMCSAVWVTNSSKRKHMWTSCSKRKHMWTSSSKRKHMWTSSSKRKHMWTSSSKAIRA